jgi:alkylhydroperoxidase family enzyme
MPFETSRETTIHTLPPAIQSSNLQVFNTTLSASIPDHPKMRLTYTPDHPTNLTPPENEIVQRVLTRRGDRGLTVLDRTLLHSPPITDGWNSLLGAIRTQTSLPTDLRELAICRVAVLNQAWYEWTHHAPLLLQAEGFTADMLEVVRRLNQECGRGPLTEKQWLVLRYVDAMTREVRVEEGLFEELSGGKGEMGGFSEKEIVELTATVAVYNCVSRFLVALDVGEMNGGEMR